MATVPVASHKAFLGIAKETTKGTAVASTAYIPFDLGTLKLTPGQMLLEDKGARGAPGDVYGHVPGVNWAEVGWSGSVYVDAIGWILAGLFGEEAVSGTGPYTHVFSTLNSSQQQPKAYTLNPNYGVANRQVPGSQFSELGLSWTADGLLVASVKAVGFPSATASAPTPSFGATVPLTGWQMTGTIGGSVSADVLSGEVTIKRNVTRIHAGNISSGAPASVWVGGISIDGKLQLVMESDTEMARLTVPASTTVDLLFQPDAGDALHLTSSKVSYTAAEPDLGKDWVELPVTFTADLNATDVGASGGYGPGKVTLINAIAGSVYL